MSSLDMCNPICILGMLGRTGTNFLYRLLLNHAQCVSCNIDEVYLAKHINLLKEYVVLTQEEWQPRGAGGRKQHLAKASDLFYAHLGDGILSHIHDLAQTYCPFDSHRQHLLFKTPSIENIEAFTDCFPKVPIIILVRDGRAVVESQCRSFGYERADVMRWWATAAEHLIEFINSPSFRGSQHLVVKYELLHTQTTEELRKILDFLNLDSENYDFEQAINLPVVGSSTYRQQQGSSISWQAFHKTSDFKPLERAAHWSDADNQEFDLIAGQSMDYFGYGDYFAQA